LPTLVYKYLTLFSYYALLVLITLWILVFAPNTSAMVFALIFQPLPLLLPMKGLLEGKPYTYAWSSFFALYYFMLGIADAAVAETRLYGLVVTSLSIVFFVAAISYARKQGKALRQATADTVVTSHDNELQKDVIEKQEDNKDLPWTSMITGAFCLTPMGFLFSAKWANGAYLVMLLFPFVFYFLAIILGLFISFGFKVTSNGKIGFSSIAFIKWLNYFSFLSCFIIIAWGLAQMMDIL